MLQSGRGINQFLIAILHFYHFPEEIELFDVTIVHILLL